MRRMLSLLVVIVVLLGACGQLETEPKVSSEPAQTTSELEETSDPVNIKVLALKGPTAMGMVQFMNEAQAGNLKDHNYEFQIASAIDEVAPKLLQGEVDIAAVPANLSSVLFNNTKGKVSVLGINTLGVLYVVEKGESVNSLKDLKGKTIYASGKGATPEYVLNYLLAQNGMNPAEDVMIEWKSEHSECLAALASGEGSIAMLPQPFVSVAQGKIENLRVAADLTKEWSSVQPDSTLITGVVVARQEFIEKNPEAISAFLKHYKESVDYVNANTEEAAQLVGKYDIVPSPVAVKALPYCNIVLVTGKEMKEKLSGYLSVLYEQNPKSIGGALPSDEFYYSN